MPVYLITYDLNKETVRPKITQTIKEYEAWAKLSESSYAILTNLSAESVYDSMSRHLDGNDQLYVITLSKPYAGQGEKEVNDWLELVLPL